MAAVARTIGSGDAVSPLEMTVLLTLDESLDAQRRDQESDTDHQGRDAASTITSVVAAVCVYSVSPLGH